MSIHIIPINDLKKHTEESTCECCPRLIIEEGEMIFIHNTWDKREGNEDTNEQRKQIQASSIGHDS